MVIRPRLMDQAGPYVEFIGNDLKIAVLWLAAAVIIVIVPLSATNYTNSQLSLVAAFSVAILGLNLVTGYAGQVSLGQSAFLGLGAYSAAIATAAGWPVSAAFAAACAVPAVIGLLVGLPAWRRDGHSLAMVTLALRRWRCRWPIACRT